MNKVIIFGIQDFAELAHYYLENDSENQVVGFSVHQNYMTNNHLFKGLPIVAFEDIESSFSPTEYKFFAPLSPMKMNRFRESIYNEIKAKGYEMISYISSKATIFDNKIGDNCFILEGNVIQPFTSIGNNIVLWSGNHIGHHCIVEDHVMFTSHVVLSGHCKVEKYSMLGVNSTIRDGVTIAEGTFVGMGACIIKNTQPWRMYKGNPAFIDDKSTKEF